MINIKGGEAIIVSAYWPTNTFGGNIANRASLLAYLQVFSKIHYIWVADEKWGAGQAFSRTRAGRLNEWSTYNIDFHHIPLLCQAKWLRFVKSLFSKLPAIAMQYARISKDLALMIDEIVRGDPGKKTKRILIFEDVPPACCMGEIKRVVPDMLFAIRSHNVASQVFEGFARTGEWFKDILWRHEIRKIQRFEKNVCESADKVWAISEQDALEYKKILSLTVDGELGACLDIVRYANVEAGDLHTVVSIGGLDLRKGKGWDAFIDNVWPVVREKIPGAKLVIAGSGSEKYQDAQLGIEGLGFVKDEREVLARGQIFLNPQRSGSGIKLKSIVAMLSGKSLVATRTGLQGVAGRHGEHYLLAEDQSELVDHLCRLMTDTNEADRLSENARKIAVATYGLANFLTDATPVVGAFRDMHQTEMRRS